METRIILQSYPRWKWEAAFSVLRSSATYGELQTLVGFFNSLYGSWDSFLYPDADDNSVSNQSIGTGDGSTINFQLVRAWGGFVEPVLAPNLTVVPQLWVNGVLKTYGTDYTINAWGNTGGPGLINFLTGAPASGATITASFSYYWPCRMQNDSLDVSMFLSGMYEAKKFAFISCKN